MAKLKDPVSCITHLIGAVLSIPISVFLILTACKYGTARHIVSFTIFGVSLWLLYSASTIYHMLAISAKGQEILRKIDHIMIFVLIIGTYIPVCLIPLNGIWGYTLLGIVAALGVGGIVMKIFWIDAPSWLSALIYICMGWISLTAIYPIIKNIDFSDFRFLLIGGIIYTLGGIIYPFQKWKISKYFGAHEIFHLFVMGGSTMHIIFTYRLIAY